MAEDEKVDVICEQLSILLSNFVKKENLMAHIEAMEREQPKNIHEAFEVSRTVMEEQMKQGPKTKKKKRKDLKVIGYHQWETEGAKIAFPVVAAKDLPIRYWD